MDMTVKENYYDLSQSVALGDLTIQFRTALPRKEKTRMALDMAEAGLVFDDDLGLAYEAYTGELVLVVCMMRYYTDLNMSAYEGEEGWYALHDILESHGVLDHLYGYLAPDLEKVKAVYEEIRDASLRTFQHRHSLDYLAKKSFGSLLSTEDITKSIAEAADVNNTMVDLLEAFSKVKEPSKIVDSGLLKFAKRDLAGK